MHRQLIALFHYFHHLFQAAEVRARRHATGIEIQRQRNQIDVAGTLSVAEQAAFDPIGTGQQRQLRAGHAGTAIVMRMYADRHIGATAEVTAEPLNLIGIHVGRTHLHRRRQVDDHRPLRPRLPHLRHRLADLQREL